jgi:hypothetical protein
LKSGIEGKKINLNLKALKWNESAVESQGYVAGKNYILTVRGWYGFGGNWELGKGNCWAVQQLEME